MTAAQSRFLATFREEGQVSGERAHLPGIIFLFPSASKIPASLFSSPYRPRLRLGPYVGSENNRRYFLGLGKEGLYIELDAPICNFPFRKQWCIAMGSGSCIRSGERDITVSLAHPKWEVRKVQRQGGLGHAQFLYGFEVLDESGIEGNTLFYLALRSLYNSHFPSQCTIACEMGNSQLQMKSSSPSVGVGVGGLTHTEQHSPSLLTDISPGGQNGAGQSTVRQSDKPPRQVHPTHGEGFHDSPSAYCVPLNEQPVGSDQTRN